MRNKVFILSLSLIMVLCSSFSVFASTIRVVDFCEPATSDTQGYLAVMDGNGDCNVFYWSILPYSWSNADNRGGYPSMNLVLYDDEIVFTAISNSSARVTLTRVFNSTVQAVSMSESFTTSTQYFYTGMTDIEYYCYSGNVGIVDDNISTSSNYLSMVWGDSTSYQADFDRLVSRLYDIDSSINDLYGRLGSTNEYLYDIENEIDDVEELLEEIEANTDDVEDWLADIEDEVDYVEERLQQIDYNTDDVEDWLSDIEDDVDYVEEYLYDIRELIEDIIDADVSQSTSSLDDSSIDDLEDNEKDVVIDKSDALDDLNLEFGSAFGSVMDMISSAWQSHPKVFTLLIMCLTVGLIKLILNR